MVGEPVAARRGATTWSSLEATIDDTSPQLYEHVVERLLAAGARDAFLEPVVMKKSRPGVTLRVLADPADRERLAAIVFAETSTIGLRWTTARRMVLPREERHVGNAVGHRARQGGARAGRHGRTSRPSTRTVARWRSRAGCR